MQSSTFLAGIVILEIIWIPARQGAHPPFVMFCPIPQQPESKQIPKIYRSEIYLQRFSINEKHRFTRAISRVTPLKL